VNISCQLGQHAFRTLAIEQLSHPQAAYARCAALWQSHIDIDCLMGHMLPAENSAGDQAVLQARALRRGQPEEEAAQVRHRVRVHDIALPVYDGACWHLRQAHIINHVSFVNGSRQQEGTVGGQT
jgi:hypothetical protein